MYSDSMDPNMKLNEKKDGGAFGPRYMVVEAQAVLIYSFDCQCDFAAQCHLRAGGLTGRPYRHAMSAISRRISTGWRLFSVVGSW